MLTLMLMLTMDIMDMLLHMDMLDIMDMLLTMPMDMLLIHTDTDTLLTDHIGVRNYTDKRNHS